MCVSECVCSNGVALGSVFFMTLAMMTREKESEKESEINLYSQTPLSYPNNTTSYFRLLNDQQHLIYPHNILILQHPSEISAAQMQAFKHIFLIILKVV